MQLVIKRSEWLHSEGAGRSRLLRSDDGKKCCLGFLALACGLTKEDIVDRQTPAELRNTGKVLPVLFSSLLTGGRIGNRLTQLCMDLMGWNDTISAVAFPQQEPQLTRLFKQIDVDVTFVD